MSVRQPKFPAFTSDPCSHPVLALFLCGKRLARWAAMSKRFVYVLRNHEIPPKYYTGLISDVARRVAAHNTYRCSHTADHGPWSLDVAIEFADERRAVAFERYLKSGSGVAFAQRHLRWRSSARRYARSRAMTLTYAVPYVRRSRRLADSAIRWPGFESDLLGALPDSAALLRWQH